MPGGDEWKQWPVFSADDAFLDYATGIQQRAAGYETDEAIRRRC